IGGKMDNLALQVGEIDIVGIGNADGAHSGSGKIKGDRRAKTAGADDQHSAVKQLLLPLAANLFEDDMPRVAFDLGFGQHDQRPPPIKYKNSITSPSLTGVVTYSGRSRISPFSSTVTYKRWETSSSSSSESTVRSGFSATMVSLPLMDIFMY